MAYEVFNRRSSDTYIKRKCRETGTYVILAAPGVELAAEEGWVTICDAHGGCVCHETRALAEQWLSHPKEWCPQCQGFEEVEKPDVTL
jgi:hypothetical protein